MARRPRGFGGTQYSLCYGCCREGERCVWKSVFALILFPLAKSVLSDAPVPTLCT